MEDLELFSPIAVAVLGGCALVLYLQWKGLRRPPCIQVWIPWIGAGFEFGKAPLEFIEKARIKYGPIFTICIMGKRMTFVTEEEGIDVFLKSKHVNFEQAAQIPVYNTAWIPKNVFFTLHEKLYVIMKGKMGPVSIPQYTEQLAEEFQEQLENLGSHGIMELNDLVRRVLYPVTVNTLLMKGLFFTNEKGIKEFHQHFKTYDEGFEYGLHLPDWLFRNWSKSKRWLLALLEKNIQKIKSHTSAKDNSRTLLQVVLDIVDTETHEHSPNYGLILLWASLANAAPIAFWTLAFILSHPDIHRAISESLSSVFGTAGGDKIQVSNEDLKQFLLIKWCILEAIRLRAPGIITRKVIKPVKILNYTVPSGDLLMLSPFWLHRNPKYFSEPELFKPERWEKANLEKHAFLDGFMAFGGGKFQCPGRWFALAEIQMCIVLILYKYDCHLLDPLPKQSCLHLVGVPQPEGQCRIEYKKKNMISSGAQED